MLLCKLQGDLGVTDKYPEWVAGRSNLMCRTAEASPRPECRLVTMCRVPGTNMYRGRAGSSERRPSLWHHAYYDSGEMFVGWVVPCDDKKHLTVWRLDFVWNIVFICLGAHYAFV